MAETEDGYEADAAITWARSEGSHGELNANSTRIQRELNAICSDETSPWWMIINQAEGLQVVMAVG